MAFELTIEFRGLCALVPSGERGPLRVVLVNARGHRPIEAGYAIKPHVPCIEFRKDWTLMHGSTETEPDHEEGDRHFVFLDREDLVLEAGSQSPQPLQFNPDLIIAMENVSPAHKEASSTVLARQPGDAVGARFRFSAGTFGAVNDGNLLAWRLGELGVGPGGSPEKYAYRSRLTTTTGGGVALVARKQGSEDELWRLTPAEAASPMLTVWDSEWSTIVAGGATDTDRAGPDHDFWVFYDLCASVPSARPVPFPAREIVSDAPRCMHPRFAYDTNA